MVGVPETGVHQNKHLRAAGPGLNAQTWKHLGWMSCCPGQVHLHSTSPALLAMPRAHSYRSQNSELAGGRGAGGSGGERIPRCNCRLHDPVNFHSAI